MNNKKDLIKEAIADAKAVREVALANAKLALQEAFEPKLKTIMSAHLEEELNEEDIKEEELEEMMKYEEENEENEKMEEEIDINALLAELEEASKDGEYEDEKMEEDANLEEAKEKEEEEEEEEEKEEEKEDEDIDVGDMTKEDIVDLIRQEISAQLDGEEVEDEMGAEEADDMMGDEDMEDMMMEGEDLEEGLAPDIMNALNDFAAQHGMTVKELLSQAAAVVGTLGGVGAAMKQAHTSYKAGLPPDTVVRSNKDDKDLEEAFKTINILKNELNEVNLLNAKLLYANKLFNKYSLSESQKLKVINSFDNAETVRETKLVYNTLNESFESESKVSKQKSKSLTEGLGMASKPTGVSKPAKQTLNESNDFVSRLQKLANIKL